MISREVLARRNAKIRLLYEKDAKYTARTCPYTLASTATARATGADRREEGKTMGINGEWQNVKKVGIITMM